MARLLGRGRGLTLDTDGTRRRPAGKSRLPSCPVSILETLLIFGVIPIAIVGIVGALSFLAKRQPGLDITPYRLSDTWVNGSVLWSATDEVTPHGGHTSHAAATADSIGGSASGKW